MVRAFVAVELPDRVAAALEPALGALGGAEIRGLRPVASGAAHLTLRFLGDVPGDRIPAISEALDLAASALGPFNLRLGEPGAFPPSGPPGVLWIGLEGDTAAASLLQGAVGDALASLGYPPEERDFTPHVTLARLGRTASRPERERALDALRDVLNAHPPTGAAFTVRSVGLMRSRLSRHGAKYERLAVARLGTGAGDA